MIRSLCLAAMMVALSAPASLGAMYFEVFTEAEAAGSQASPFLDTVAVKDGVAYALVRDITGASGGSVVAYDGSTFTEIMDSAAWLAAGATSDIGGFLGASVVDRGLGDKVRFLNFFDNSIWEVDTTTGTPVRVVSEAMINAFTAGAVNLTASNAMLPDGTAIAYDGTSDSVLQITPGGFVFNQISSAELSSLTGSSNLSGTGFTLVGADLYFGSNSGDSLYKWNVISDTGSVVFDTAALEALSDDIDGSAGIDDVFFAPDGLVYFYEDDADYIYSFDPADPTGTLAVVLTEDELNAGPGSDGVAQFAWWNGGLAWTDQGDGFYSLVPEPTSALLLSLAAAAGLRRRR
ncbi:PEP-CTERM sorting domain-containing protein [Botrimarina sp.]|uniref:PEP-CTERM sorting domain-containing protein n=1 Tax=Botrimarina sp. TaxID=2795802 RepID=UPI0032EB11C0